MIDLRFDLASVDCCWLNDSTAMQNADFDIGIVHNSIDIWRQRRQLLCWWSDRTIRTSLHSRTRARMRMDETSGRSRTDQCCIGRQFDLDKLIAYFIGRTK